MSKKDSIQDIADQKIRTMFANSHEATFLLMSREQRKSLGESDVPIVVSTDETDTWFCG